MLAPPFLLLQFFLARGRSHPEGKGPIWGARLKLYLLTEDGAGRAPALKAPSPRVQARTSFPQESGLKGWCGPEASATEAHGNGRQFPGAS